MSRSADANGPAPGESARLQAQALLAQATQVHPVGGNAWRNRPLARWVLPVAWALGSWMGLGSALPAQALPSDPGTQVLQVHMGVLQQPLEVVSLGSWFSQPGEAKIAFLKRVGRGLVDYAQKTQFEACGVIWVGGTPESPTYAVPLISAQAHARCPLIPGLKPVQPGYTATDESIHVHPEDGRYRINTADRLLDPSARRKPPYAWGRSHGARGFSPEDTETGPGYLVADGNLLYSAAQGDVVDHGAVAPARPSPRRPRP